MITTVPLAGLVVIVNVDGSIVPSRSVSLASTGIVTGTPGSVVTTSLSATGLWLKADASGLRVRNVVMVAVVAVGSRLHAKAVDDVAGPEDYAVPDVIEGRQAARVEVDRSWVNGGLRPP